MLINLKISKKFEDLKIGECFILLNIDDHESTYLMKKVSFQRATLANRAGVSVSVALDNPVLRII